MKEVYRTLVYDLIQLRFYDVGVSSAFYGGWYNVFFSEVTRLVTMSEECSVLVE
jgi:hypothetical protein